MKTFRIHKKVQVTVVVALLLFAVCSAFAAVKTAQKVVKGNQARNWTPSGFKKIEMRGNNWLNDKLIVIDKQTGKRYTLYGRGGNMLVITSPGKGYVLDNRQNAANFTIDLTFYY